MNSLNNYKNNETPLNNCKQHDCNYHQCCPLPGKALLQASNGNIVLPNVTFTTPSTVTLNQPIAIVTVDNTCLPKAKRIIDFAGTLTSTATPILAATLTFTLFKICSNSKVKQPLTSFSFSAILLVPTFPGSSSLNFEYSPCDDSCEDSCCSYLLELTSISSLITSTASISISGILSALAIEKQC